MARNQVGNFLLQALLAISLVIAFMPMLARKMSNRQSDAQMAAAARQIESAANAASIFIRDNSDALPYGISHYESEKFNDALEPYGLPMGFSTRTPFGQKISMTVARTKEDTLAFIVASGGKLLPVQRTELSLRIGFWAAAASTDGRILTGATGGWVLNANDVGIKFDPDAIYVRVANTGELSELLAKKSKRIEDNKFHTDLLMGGRSIRNVRDAFARVGDFNSVLSGDFVLSGENDGGTTKNIFGEINSRRATFQDALFVTGGTVLSNNISASSISEYGELGNLEADILSVSELSVASGAFAGPAKWQIRGDAILENVAMSVERMEVVGAINVARGQDVFMDEYDMTYNVKSGIEAGIVSATHLTLRDQTSNALIEGSTGPLILDIRPAGTSVLLDAEVDGIDNGQINIPISYDDDSGAVQTCESVIKSLGVPVHYGSNSLAQNIVCRYVLLQRLEERIDCKKRLKEGKGSC